MLTVRSLVLLAVLLFAMWILVTLLYRGLWRTSWSREACAWIQTVNLSNVTFAAQKFLSVLIFFTILIIRRLVIGVAWCLLSCLFLVVIRMQNTRVLKDQEFNSLTGQKIPCMLLNQSVFHFHCHSSSPLLPIEASLIRFTPPILF